MNRPENPEDFMKGNFGFASELLNLLKKQHRSMTVYRGALEKRMELIVKNHTTTNTKKENK